MVSASVRPYVRVSIGVCVCDNLQRCGVDQCRSSTRYQIAGINATFTIYTFHGKLNFYHDANVAGRHKTTVIDQIVISVCQQRAALSVSETKTDATSGRVASISVTIVTTWTLLFVPWDGTFRFWKVSDSKGVPLFSISSSCSPADQSKNDASDNQRIQNAEFLTRLITEVELRKSCVCFLIFLRL